MVWPTSWEGVAIRENVRSKERRRSIARFGLSKRARIIPPNLTFPAPRAMCREHGEIRTAIADIPIGRFHPCPLCNRRCDYKLLGEGGTQRSLPFWDKIRESVSMRQLIDNQWVVYKAQASATL